MFVENKKAKDTHPYVGVKLSLVLQKSDNVDLSIYFKIVLIPTRQWPLSTDKNLGNSCKSL